MIRVVLALIVSLLLSGCVKRYVAPTSGKNSAILTIKNSTNTQPTIQLYVRIDNQYIKYPQNAINNYTTYVSSGKHTLYIEPTIYYNYRAKYAKYINLKINFKRGHRYTIELKPYKHKLSKIDEDTYALFTIYDNSRVLYRKKLYMKDSFLRSGVSKEEFAEINGMIIASTLIH